MRRALAADEELVLATSGTASRPRSVRRTAASWRDSFAPYGTLAGIDGDARVAVPGPLHATMNLFAVVQAEWSGASVVDDVSDATHVVLTPAQLDRMLDRRLPDGLVAVTAGDRLPASLAARAAATGLTVHHYYGAAELSFVAWGRDADDLRPFPGVEVRTDDSDAVGVIRVRSPYVAEAVRDAEGWRPVRGDDGWAGVGDRGRLVPTPDGVRLLVDGRPDVIVTGGATVHVADVEAILAPFEVLVVGVPHPRLGALVVGALPPGVDPAPARTAARDLLPGSHRPRRWVSLPRPLTTQGKIDRVELRRAVEEALA